MTFSVSVSAGVKSNSSDLSNIFFLQKTSGPPTQLLSFSGADNAFPAPTHLDVEKSAFSYR